MKKIFVAIIALAVLCNLAAASWNTSQYNDILNDARRMDEIEYPRQRQAVLDKRAAQDYALRYESDKRKAAREKAEHELYMRTLRARQRQAQPYGSPSSSSYRKPRIRKKRDIRSK